MITATLQIPILNVLLFFFFSLSFFSFWYQNINHCQSEYNLIFSFYINVNLPKPCCFISFFFLFFFTVDDASGRYTNGFFWGNSYFTGSATECEYIDQNYVRKNEKATSASTIDEVQEFNTEPHKKGNLGLSGTNLLTQTFIDQPPYPLGFYIMRISINTTLSPTVINI